MPGFALRLVEDLFRPSRSRRTLRRRNWNVSGSVECLEERRLLSVDPLQIAGAPGREHPGKGPQLPEVAPGRWIAVLKEGVDPDQFAQELRGRGRDATTERVTATATASSKPLADVKLPAPAAGLFDGSYSGSISWYAFDGEDSLSGSLGLSLSVAGGRITVTAPVGGSGSVGASGGAGGSASGLGFSCGFSGGFVAGAATGPASGSGTFGCSSPDGRAWGGWSVARR